MTRLLLLVLPTTLFSRPPPGQEKPPKIVRNRFPCAREVFVHGQDAEHDPWEDALHAYPPRRTSRRFALESCSALRAWAGDNPIGVRRPGFTSSVSWSKRRPRLACFERPTGARLVWVRTNNPPRARALVRSTFIRVHRNPTTAGPAAAAVLRQLSPLIAFLCR